MANALEQGRIDPISVIDQAAGGDRSSPLGLGALAGFVLNQLEYVHPPLKRMKASVAFVLLTVGLDHLLVGPVHCSAAAAGLQR